MNKKVLMRLKQKIKVKAAVLYNAGEPLQIKSGIEFPDLGYGKVFVEIFYSGVCRSQLMEVKGWRGEDKFLPHMLGHEGVGQVLDTGDGVTKVKQGDFVVLGWIKGKGIDAGGTVYKYENQNINSGPVATFNDFAVISENRCYVLPSGVPMDVAVLFGCAIPTGAGIIINEIQPASGSSIAIFGLGGIGMSALMATNLYDFKKVIAVDVEKTKLHLSKEFGATNLIDAGICDPVKEIISLTGGRGVDYSVDAAGQVKTIEQAFAVVRENGGLCVFASHPPTGEKICLDPHDLISGKQIKGSWGGACHPDRDIPRYAELYRQGKLPLEKLLSKPYSLEDINRALDDLDNRKITRLLIKMN